VYWDILYIKIYTINLPVGEVKEAEVEVKEAEVEVKEAEAEVEVKEVEVEIKEVEEVLLIAMELEQVAINLVVKILIKIGKELVQKNLIVLEVKKRWKIRIHV
jgi:hypothetical protein